MFLLGVSLEVEVGAFHSQSLILIVNTGPFLEMLHDHAISLILGLRSLL